MTTPPPKPSERRPAARSWRDPWAWACVIAVVPLLLHSWKALLGEPFADDYDFLYDALLEPRRSFFDGGGAVIYWRPLSRQAYYTLFGPLMLSHPRVLASIHACLLVMAVWLIYRTLRVARWDGASAALAATFPLFTEGTRTFLLWPTTFQDLGALLFSALALHEAAHRRWATTAIALLAGLLCKEIALVTAVFLLWMPIGTDEPWRRRIRPAMASAGVVAVWGVVYALVRQSAHVLFQRHLEEGRAPLPQRLLWAFGNAGTDALNLDPRHPTWGLAVVAIAVALALGGILIGRRAKERSPHPAWILWGLAWFALTAVTLSETYPRWGGFRSAFGLVGLGIGAGATLSGLGVAGVTSLALLRLTTFFLAPAPPVVVTQAPPVEGVGLDFNSLARLQRYAAETRTLVTARFPRLPPRAVIGQHQRPLMTEAAFAGDHALRMWYRDTTLRWVSWEDIVETPTLRPAAVVQYQPHLARQTALIEGDAMGQYLDALDSTREGRWQAALLQLGRADSLQSDRGAAVFLGMLAGKRALCLLALDQGAAAVRDEAMRGLALWRHGRDARHALALLLAMDKDYRGALAQLDTLLAEHPGDESALTLRDGLRAEVEKQGARRP